MIENLPFVAAAILVALGMYTLMFKKNLIKMVIGLTLLEAGVNLFLVALGYIEMGGAPIFTSSTHQTMVLPTPQALTLTSIVIGLAVEALALAIIVQIYKHYGSIESNEVRRLKG